MTTALPDNTDEVIEIPHVTGPGERLRVARESLGWSVEEVTRRLRLEARFIVALEADDYARLPYPGLARGYLRSYARLVNVPAERIIEDYERQESPIQEPELRSTISYKVRRRNNDAAIRWVTYLLMALLVGLAWWWHKERETRVERSEATASTPSDTVTWTPNEDVELGLLPEDISAVQGKALESTEGLPDSAPSPMTLPAISETPSSVANEESPMEPTATAAEDEVGVSVSNEVGSATASEEQPAGASVTEPREIPEVNVSEGANRQRGKLVLHFNNDCWVEISDANGTRLLRGIAEAGTTETLEGQPPLKVLLGNAKGVSVTYNGRAFDYRNYMQRNIARFVLGDSRAEDNGT
jgi:cytoskeleton protein RodZ